MNKYVICGPKDAGKTTIAKELLKKTDRKVAGFFTEKFPEKEIDGLCPIYIYPVGGEPIFDDAHLIGLGGEGTHYTNADVFNTVGVEYISTDDKETLILMDEIGFLEMDAKQFKDKVFECLKSDNPVVIMLKQKMQLDFIRQIRDFEDAVFIELDENNRDGIADMILSSI